MWGRFSCGGGLNSLDSRMHTRSQKRPVSRCAGAAIARLLAPQQGQQWRKAAGHQGTSDRPRPLLAADANRADLAGRWPRRAALRPAALPTVPAHSQCSEIRLELRLLLLSGPIPEIPPALTLCCYALGYSGNTCCRRDADNQSVDGDGLPVDCAGAAGARGGRRRRRGQPVVRRGPARAGGDRLLTSLSLQGCKDMVATMMHRVRGICNQP